MTVLFLHYSDDEGWPWVPGRQDGHLGEDGNFPEIFRPQAGHNIREEPAGWDEAPLEEIVETSRREGEATAAGLQGGQEGECVSGIKHEIRFLFLFVLLSFTCWGYLTKRNENVLMLCNIQVISVSKYRNYYLLQENSQGMMNF